MTLLFLAPGLLFRDKLDADTAIFSTVQEVKSGAGWKPTLVESYTKEFGNRFNVISKVIAGFMV
jgi:hypothetical protein